MSSFDQTCRDVDAKLSLHRLKSGGEKRRETRVSNHNIVPKENQPILGIITGHWLSLVGACIVTTAAICWILALPSQFRGHVSNPYIGILLFVVLPIVFVGGLMLIPLGVYLSRRKLRKGFAGATIDRPTSIRRLAIFFAVTTMLQHRDRIAADIPRSRAYGKRSVLRTELPCHEAGVHGLPELDPLACALRRLPRCPRGIRMGGKQAIRNAPASRRGDEQPSPAHRVGYGVESSRSLL